MRFLEPNQHETRPPSGWMAILTRFVLHHRRLVALFWLIVTIIGIATVGSATKAFSTEYSVPGREGYQTNAAIRQSSAPGETARRWSRRHPASGTSVASPAVRPGCARSTARIERPVPGVRIASYASTNDRAFVSRDGRTTFVLAYPPPNARELRPKPAAVSAVSAALRGVTVAGGRVQVTGFDALNVVERPEGRARMLAEGLLGGLGALVVLGFVFASLLAFVPLIVALISIMTSFLLVWGADDADVGVRDRRFLIALVGLGVAIDYSLLIVVRWREERAHGHDRDDAIVRAMATAGRAVVFSGTTVGIGLLALIVVAGALPAPASASPGW